MHERNGSHLRLTKHHGAGNDFLVFLDAENARPITAAEARALCDRRRGMGADGMIRGFRGPRPIEPGDESRRGAQLSMELRNADGGEAEMSGNGIRCLVQAAVDAGWVSPGEVLVDTLAGLRSVAYRAGAGSGSGVGAGQVPGVGFATVEMGRPVLGDTLPADLLGADGAGLVAARAVNMGNPHLVLLLSEPAGDALVHTAGPRLERSVPDGANVEFVWPGPAPDELTLRVWERGVGETLACGTGTCAVVAATASWDATGTHVVVHNPGGALEVDLTADGARLGGPTALVGTIDVEESILARMVAERSADDARHEQVATAR